MFGSSFSLASAGLGDLPGDTLVPGVAVFSRRALPLAAWSNGLEISGVKADAERCCLILETGVNQRWRYGGWRPSAEAAEEAAGWEEAKAGLGGLHFLAVQVKRHWQRLVVCACVPRLDEWQRGRLEGAASPPRCLACICLCCAVYCWPGLCAAQWHTHADTHPRIQRHTHTHSLSFHLP
jgi:RNA-binding protein Tab2/Atab2